MTTRETREEAHDIRILQGVFFALALVLVCLIQTVSVRAAAGFMSDSVSMYAGEGRIIEISGNDLPYNVKWESTNTKTVKVIYSDCRKALIKGVKRGSADIKAKLLRKDDSTVVKLTCRVKVRKAVRFPESITLPVGWTYKLKAKGKASWKSSAAKTVKVLKKRASSAKVKAVSKGKAVITAKRGKKKQACIVRVIPAKWKKTEPGSGKYPPASGLYPSAERKGSSIKIDWDVKLPELSADAYRLCVTSWDENSGKKKEWTQKISGTHASFANDGGCCIIRIEDPSGDSSGEEYVPCRKSSGNIKEPISAITVGESRWIDVKTAFSDGYMMTAEYTSSDPSIARVADTGIDGFLVTGCKTGRTKIRASFTDSYGKKKKTEECTVIVREAVTAPYNVTISEGDTYSFHTLLSSGWKVKDEMSVPEEAGVVIGRVKTGTVIAKEKESGKLFAVMAKRPGTAVVVVKGKTEGAGQYSSRVEVVRPGMYKKCPKASWLRLAAVPYKDGIRISWGYDLPGAKEARRGYKLVVEREDTESCPDVPVYPPMPEAAVHEEWPAYIHESVAVSGKETCIHLSRDYGTYTFRLVDKDGNKSKTVSCLYSPQAESGPDAAGLHLVVKKDGNDIVVSWDKRLPEPYFAQKHAKRFTAYRLYAEGSGYTPYSGRRNLAAGRIISGNSVRIKTDGYDPRSTKGLAGVPGDGRFMEGVYAFYIKGPDGSKSSKAEIAFEDAASE